MLRLARDVCTLPDGGDRELIMYCNVNKILIFSLLQFASAVSKESLGSR